MKRPLTQYRKIGPFVEAPNSHGPAEVAIYFEMGNIAPVAVDQVEGIIGSMGSYQGPVSGPHGVKNNVVSLQTTGNQTTYSNILSLIDEVEDETDIEVDDVELIW